MLLTSPMPFAAAVARMESKIPVASALTSAQWGQVAIGLSDRAFFSSRVNDIRIVAAMQSRFLDALTLTRRGGGAYMDRGRFIADMRVLLHAAPGISDDLADITSQARLKLIYDFNIEDAREYGRWLASQDPAILDGFPCNELVRVESRLVPRGWRKGPGGALLPEPEESWPARWERAGGRFFSGRMIAEKNDPIWEAISRFGRPWPPFDFNSGMGLHDISRREAEALGVIAPDAPAPPPQQMSFNHNLQASVPEASPGVLDGFKSVFGDQVDVGRDGKIVWQGERLQALYQKALTDPAVNWSVNLGLATPEAIEAAHAAGTDLTGATLVIDSGHVRHAVARHGAAEARGDQRPLTALDFELIPFVWRAPDQVAAGDSAGSLIFTKDLVGRTVMIVYDRQAKTSKWEFVSLYAKKEGGTQ